MTDKTERRHDLFIQVKAYDGFEEFYAYGRGVLSLSKFEPRGDGWELVTEDASRKTWRRKQVVGS
jgi:hypothetical protein